VDNVCTTLWQIYLGHYVPTCIRTGRVSSFVEDIYQKHSGLLLPWTRCAFNFRCSLAWCHFEVWQIEESGSRKGRKPSFHKIMELFSFKSGIVSWFYS